MTSQPHPQGPSPLLGEMTREQLEHAFENSRREYGVTVKVVSVLAERLLEATGAVALSISDEALMACPDLDARRDESRKQVIITVAR